MKKYYAYPLIAFALTFAFCLLVSDYLSIHFGEVLHFPNRENLVAEYINKFQVPLFSGFLTLSGFLLSLTTFIVVKMHEAVYQDKDYYERVKSFQRINPNYSPSKPLEELSLFLLVSVITSLCASFSQVIIGNIKVYFTVIFCIALASAAAVFVLTACVLIKRNINVWIDFMKDKKNKEHANEEEN